MSRGVGGRGGFPLGEVGDQFETIHNLTSRGGTSLDTKGEDTAEPARQVPFGQRVAGMAFQTGIRDPADVLVLFQPPRQSERVAGVSLGAQAERLQTQDQLLRRKGVEGGPEIAQDLDPYADGKRDGTKRLPELEAVVAFGGLGELREPRCVLAPVELAAVDDDTADGGAVATDPLGRAVHDNVRAVVDRAGKVSTGTEGIVNL